MVHPRSFLDEVEDPRDDEATLASGRRRRKDGDQLQSPLETYLREINETKLLTAEDERMLARQIAMGDVQARDRMVRANLRLVVNIARSYVGKGLALQDLIEEGNLGLLLASERFDERLGYRFSTFAVNLIRARMKRENDNQGRMIRVPVHQWEAIRRVDKVRGELEGELGREALASELALKTGLKSCELEELSALKAGVISFHQVMASDGETPLEEVLPDPDSLAPFSSKVDLTGKFDRYLMSLEETERRVVCCLYGLGGMPQLSLAETSRLLRLSHAELGRVRQRALVAIRDEIASVGAFYASAA